VKAAPGQLSKLSYALKNNWAIEEVQPRETAADKRNILEDFKKFSKFFSDYVERSSEEKSNIVWNAVNRIWFYALMIVVPIISGERRIPLLVLFGLALRDVHTYFEALNAVNEREQFCCEIYKQLQKVSFHGKSMEDLKDDKSSIEERLSVITMDRTLNPDGMPDAFICPITLDVIEEPAMLNDDQRYLFEYSAIQQWFRKSDLNPKTNKKCRKQVSVDLKLQHKINMCRSLLAKLKWIELAEFKLCAAENPLKADITGLFRADHCEGDKDDGSGEALRRRQLTSPNLMTNPA
jgi:hypothetical protein